MTEHPASRLSLQQQRCLRLTYDRRSGGEIAQELGISKSTVESHLAQARKTLGVSTSVRAAILFHEYEAWCDPASNIAPVAETVEMARPGAAADRKPAWRGLLPVRLSGERRNDLSASRRVVWIVILAIAAAIAFGTLTDGLRFISELVRR